MLVRDKFQRAEDLRAMAATVRRGGLPDADHLEQIAGELAADAAQDCLDDDDEDCSEYCCLKVAQ